METPAYTPHPVEIEIAERLVEAGVSPADAARAALALARALSGAPGDAAALAALTPRARLVGALAAAAAGPAGPEALPVLADIAQGAPPDPAGPRPPRQAKAAPEKARREGRLLIVDDDESVRESLADLLTDFGYSTATAASGEEALSRLGAESFDAVLTDVSMPGLSGWELAARIRDTNHRAVVLVLSGWGHAPPDDEERMRLVDGFVEKPVDPRALSALLSRLL